MTYFRKLTGFIQKAENDSKINPSHICLYVALLKCWSDNNFNNPVSIDREELMRTSKTKSKVTYHRGLKALHAGGYIKYMPSFHPLKGSEVWL
ncbi:MAG: hypothetical protein PSV16_12750 [Flavobacterium sp.]|nr:hypothetical protein [Flavobacterium sp.]